MTNKETLRNMAVELQMTVRSAEFELNAALEKLDSAGRWGMWDLVGGGLISGMMKHSRIDDALAHVDAARPMLMRLRSELSDMQLDFGVNTQISSFARIADFVFDGLFADIHMQGKIEDLKSDVSHILLELRRVDWALRQIDD